MKTCSKCGVPKALDGFYLVKVSEPEGRRHARCKTCHNKLTSAWSAENKEKHRELILRWERDNPGRKRELAAKRYAEKHVEISHASAERYRKNKEAISASNARWKSENRERISKTNANWFFENKDKVNSRNRNRRQTDPRFKLIVNMRRRLGHALRGHLKSQATMELLGCPLVWLEVHLESLFKLGMTWENYGPVWHVDHIKPCAKFDLTKPAHQSACFHWSNLQPLFAADNIRKSDSYHG